MRQPTTIRLVKWIISLLVWSFGLAMIAVMIAAIIAPLVLDNGGLSPDSSRMVFSGSFGLAAVSIFVRRMWHHLTRESNSQ